MAFWALSHIDKRDLLNQAIWTESPAIQAAIQPYRNDWRAGEIGAQQAMWAPRLLPWVPDLVGTSWRSKNALMVVGSAYGAFITNSHGHHEMSPSDYDQPSAGAFQERFLEAVVARRDYYAKVARLAGDVMRDASHLVLFDLCRVALVECGSRRDAQGDNVVRKAVHLFCRYVESPVPRSWLWRRFIESDASTIIALGTVAEHGLLRLFAAHLRDVRIVDSLNPLIAFTRSKDDRWPADYADTRRTIKARASQSPVPYWQVTGATESGTRRQWRVAVVPHPTGAREPRPEYSRHAVEVAFSGTVTQIAEA